MDTIFVKSVREKGPAHQAGLCTGKGNIWRRSVNVLICIGNQLGRAPVTWRCRHSDAKDSEMREQPRIKKNSFSLDFSLTGCCVFFKNLIGWYNTNTSMMTQIIRCTWMWESYWSFPVVSCCLSRAAVHSQKLRHTKPVLQCAFNTSCHLQKVTSQHEWHSGRFVCVCLCVSMNSSKHLNK